MHVRAMPAPGFAQASALEQVSPAQQAWPLAPQGAHTVVAAPPSVTAALSSQLRPVSQVPANPPPQHACPDPPHAVQVPPIPIVAPVQRPPA
jgi:hypothetical protein